MNENEDRKASMTVREQIEWLLDRIDDDKQLRTILAVVATIYSGGRW